MIDQNRDGFIDNEDLKDMLASLGKLLGLILLYIFSFYFLTNLPFRCVQDKSPVIQW